jgi:starvation-inducible outer membrane lipoprotein
MRRLSLTLGALAALLLVLACTSSDPAANNDASREASIRGIMMQNAVMNTGAIRFGGD